MLHANRLKTHRCCALNYVVAVKNALETHFKENHRHSSRGIEQALKGEQKKLKAEEKKRTAVEKKRKAEEKKVKSETKGKGKIKRNAPSASAEGSGSRSAASTGTGTQWAASTVQSQTVNHYTEAQLTSAKSSSSTSSRARQNQRAMRRTRTQPQTASRLMVYNRTESVSGTSSDSPAMKRARARAAAKGQTQSFWATFYNYLDEEITAHCNGFPAYFEFTGRSELVETQSHARGKGRGSHTRSCKAKVKPTILPVAAAVHVAMGRLHRTFTEDKRQVTDPIEGQCLTAGTSMISTNNRKRAALLTMLRR